MRITVNTTALAHELRLINQVVVAKHTLPILLHVLLRAEENLYLYATDLEVGFSTACRAEVAEPGLITLPAKHLLDLIEQLPDADVSIASEGKHVVLSCGAFRSRLQTLPAEEFPLVPEPAGKVSVLPAGQLLAMVRRVRFAISEKSSFNIKGALLTITEKALGLVATDGKRLSLATVGYIGGEPCSVILPLKLLDVISGLFSSGEVQFSQSDQHLFFIEGHRLLYSRMIAGQYPNYQRIIPAENNNRATLDRPQFAAALRRVGLASGEGQTVSLEFDSNVLAISTSSAEIGDAQEALAAAYSGPPVRFGISARYLLDFLEVAEAGTVVLDMRNGETPLLISDGADFYNVIMLMRA